MHEHDISKFKIQMWNIHNNHTKYQNHIKHEQLQAIQYLEIPFKIV